MEEMGNEISGEEYSKGPKGKAAGKKVREKLKVKPGKEDMVTGIG
jgi:hypothetical protein